MQARSELAKCMCNAARVQGGVMGVVLSLSVGDRRRARMSTNDPKRGSVLRVCFFQSLATATTTRLDCVLVVDV